MNLYCIDLIKQDSLISTDLSFQASDGGNAVIIFNNTEIWNTGKIMVPVYKSNDIKGLFVLKEKTVKMIKRKE